MLKDFVRPLVPDRLGARLRAWHRERVMARAVRRLRRHDAFVPLSDGTISDLLYAWNNPWSLREEMISQLWDDAWHTRGPILECGSGLSTILLAAAAEKRRTSVVSLEHDLRWHRRITGILERFGFRSARVLHAPLVASPSYTWYEVPPDLPSGFTLVICDGPPGDTRGGRYGLLPRVGTKLTTDCVILVDDAARPGEQAVLEKWAVEYSVRRRVAGADKPYAVVEGPIVR